MPWLQLRFNYDTTATYRVRLLSIQRHSTRAKNEHVNFFVVVVPQSNRMQIAISITSVVVKCVMVSSYHSRITNAIQALNTRSLITQLNITSIYPTCLYSIHTANETCMLTAALLIWPAASASKVQTLQRYRYLNITSAKRRLCFYLCLFVCLLDYSKGYERILWKFTVKHIFRMHQIFANFASRIKSRN